MIDLTKKIENAIKLKELKSFSTSKWLDSLMKLADSESLNFLWDEPEDNWLKLGRNEQLLMMASREIPLLFFVKDNLLSSFVKIYCDNLVSIKIDNPNEQIYQLNSSKVNNYFTWKTSVVEQNCFSINELFYATH